MIVKCTKGVIVLAGLDFTQLILLLLPGFWSLWIFKPFLGYDLESREWQIKAMMALGFGIFNLVLLSFIDLWIYNITSIEGWLIGAGIISILTGFIGGCLSKEESIQSWLYKCYKFCFRKEEEAVTTPYEKALNYLDAHRGEHCDGRYALMRVYPVGEPEKAIIGEYIWGYAETGEVILARTPLYEGLDLRLYENVVVNDPVSNRIFEIYPLSEEDMQSLQEERIQLFFPPDPPGFLGADADGEGLGFIEG